MTRRRRAAISVVLVMLTALGALMPAATRPPPVRAQAASTGTISGQITSGTAGEAVTGDLSVQMIALENSQVTGTTEAAVDGGAFKASLPVVAGRTYVPHLVYQGVNYFADPVDFADGALDVRRDFLVYSATHDAPDLTITSTVMTVVAIDRQAGQLGLEREDMIANPDDHIYVGDDQGITLRIPVPDGTVEAAGQTTGATFTLESGVLTTTAPIQPGKLTSIVTRYLVGYDRTADRYRLRVTTPLPAQRLSVRVPVGYVQSLEPGDGAVRVDDQRLTGDLEGQVVQVAQSTAATAPGGSILVDLVGLSGHRRSNPLTDSAGAAIAAVLAVVIVGGATVAAWRHRGRTA